MQELTPVRGTLDGRYDDIKSGRVKPIDGEAFFEVCGNARKNCFKRR